MKRKQLRLSDYDYASNGAYFITVCVLDRHKVLSQIQSGRVTLSNAGQIVQDTWLDLPKHYAHMELDDFVAMPNHIHGLL